MNNLSEKLIKIGQSAILIGGIPFMMLTYSGASLQILESGDRGAWFISMVVLILIVWFGIFILVIGSCISLILKLMEKL